MNHQQKSHQDPYGNGYPLFKLRYPDGIRHCCRLGNREFSGYFEGDIFQYDFGNTTPEEGALYVVNWSRKGFLVMQATKSRNGEWRLHRRRPGQKMIPFDSPNVVIMGQVTNLMFRPRRNV